MKIVSQRRIIANPAMTRPLPPPKPGRKPLRPLREPVGLGDMVETVAKPMAKLIDRVSAKLGRPTKLAGCSKCSKRRRTLNRWQPNVRSWSAWLTLARRALKTLLSQTRNPSG